MSGDDYFDDELDEIHDIVRQAQPDLQGESLDQPGARLDLSRRAFVQAVSAGLLITVTGGVAWGQRGRGGRGGSFGRSSAPTTIAARLHLGQDGTITVLTGKVEVGQGSRAELTQAAAEELRVAADRIELVMADTTLAPNDGTTAGSGTTPRTVPAVRRAAATARELLIDTACKRWDVDRNGVVVGEGAITHAASKRTMTYAQLAGDEELTKAFAKIVLEDVPLTPIADWKVLGTSVARPNRRDLVTGKHRFASDIVLPGMLYGKVLRPPSTGPRFRPSTSRPPRPCRTWSCCRTAPSWAVPRRRGSRRNMPWRPWRPRPNGRPFRSPPAVICSPT
jgi:isoquinoline 1-oxidoreductase